VAASRALLRLFHIRELEEEQNRVALESALGELNRLESALRATVERERRGRKLIETSAQTGELPDRLAGLAESHATKRLFAVLEPRIAVKQEEVRLRREEFILKRVQRRQAETLIQDAEAQASLDADRRGQQALDNWYGSRQYREQAQAEPETAAADGFRPSKETVCKASSGQLMPVIDKT